MDKQPSNDVSIQSQLLPAAEGFPNNPRLPLLVYQQALVSIGRRSAGDVEWLFETNGWHGTWRNGIYDYHHYHSNTHEVLGVCAGRARVQFGGPSGPIVAVEAGDVALLPAGTGHKCVESSEDFLVVGGYPAGREDYDLLRGEPEERAGAEDRIAAVPLPQADPIYGREGPLFEHWQPS